ncbi:acylneuraminate cytidylyltransferase family protein [Methanotorris formicicus]|uniref:Acylneuraminate cytidylyltransferase n=1 Tax=Methanotorris formicicus Mc-S-70 TaxID=647171 RepID=H1KWH2_9EURY|nr:acylneuraminate cytidylyltransferase family protein [Methanotorris formicicus]EHP89549.1 acylneuraminate cytidylyltransferase [Methanotorris formicicus Mc-S-70]
MKILGLIPARGGSKGLPRKNIKPLLGKPLIGWTIEYAKNSKYIDKVVVSTDDEEIAKVSKECGAEVPFLRPKELARDDSPTIDAIIHAINWFEERGMFFDILVLLQTTSPLRTTEDIDNAIELFLNNKEALSLVSVKENEHPPFWSLKIENRFLKPLFGEEYFRKRRQELPKSYMPNGAIFISYVNILKEYKTFYTPKTIAYIMPPERSIDIDNEFDFLLAEFILKNKK